MAADPTKVTALLDAAEDLLTDGGSADPAGDAALLFRTMGEEWLKGLEGGAQRFTQPVRSTLADVAAEIRTR